MFVRKKKNRSGTVSVVVADKSSGRFKELKTIGVSSDPEEIARLEVKARQWIDGYSGQLTLDFDESTQALREARNTIARIERTLQNTPQVILGHIYDRIGYPRPHIRQNRLRGNRGQYPAPSCHREGMPTAEQGCDSGIFEVLLRRGRAVA